MICRMVGYLLISLDVFSRNDDKFYAKAQAIRESYLSGVGDELSSAALILACFFCLYQLVKVAIKLFAGNPFPWMEVFRPVLICVCISMWSGVIGLTDSVGKYVSDSIVTITDSAAKEASLVDYNERANEILRAASEANYDTTVKGSEGKTDDVEPVFQTVTDAQNAQVGWLRKIADFCKGLFVVLTNPMKLQLILIDVIQFLLSAVLMFAFALAREAMMMLSQFYLIFLGILGPFAFAFGIIPELNKISGWIASYIQYWLWVPMIALVQSLYCSVGCGEGLAKVMNLKSVDGNKLDNILDASVAANFDTVAQAADILLIQAAASVACIILLLGIPKICQIVVSSGQNLLGGAASGGLNSVMTATRTLSSINH